MKISASFRRKPEYRRPAGMLYFRLWIPDFAGMTEMDQTMIKSQITGSPVLHGNKFPRYFMPSLRNFKQLK